MSYSTGVFGVGVGFVEDSYTLKLELISSSYLQALIWGIQVVSPHGLFSSGGDVGGDATLFQEGTTIVFLVVCFTRVPVCDL